MSEFGEYLRDLLRGFGPIELRRMFGGQGVYRDGLMFALVVDDVVYLKADERTVADFERAGCPPFEYVRQGEIARLAYHRMPDAALEDTGEAVRWARLAFDAALRAQAARHAREAARAARAAAKPAATRKAGAKQPAAKQPAAKKPAATKSGAKKPTARKATSGPTR